MALKKEQLSQEEKVAAILKNVQKVSGAKIAAPSLDISSKCNRCGRVLTPLERITFFNKCAECTADAAAKSRESFFKRYIMLSIVYVASMLLAVFLSRSADNVTKLFGTVFQAVVIGVSVMYVAYKVLPRMLPNARQKTILWLSMGFAVGVDMIVMTMTVMSRNNALFYCCSAAFVAYVVYDAYHDYAEITNKYNLLAVYRRKSLDPEYLREVSETLKAPEVVAKKDILNGENNVLNTEIVALDAGNNQPAKADTYALTVDETQALAAPETTFTKVETKAGTDVGNDGGNDGSFADWII